MDHINGIKHDNRWENLREATVSENGFNKGKYNRNKSGYKGVHYHKHAKGWTWALPRQGMKTIWGKYYDSPEEAYAERLKAEIQYHGEFRKLELVE